MLCYVCTCHVVCHFVTVSFYVTVCMCACVCGVPQYLCQHQPSPQLCLLDPSPSDLLLDFSDVLQVGVLYTHMGGTAHMQVQSGQGIIQ